MLESKDYIIKMFREEI